MHIRGVLLECDNLVSLETKKKGDEMRRNSLMENGCSGFLAIGPQQGFCWLPI